MEKQYLMKYFTDEGGGFYKSNKTSFGMSPRHDYNLWVHYDEDSVQIIWKNSISQETVFIGDGVKTEEDFRDVFRLLGVLNFIESKE